MQIPLLFQDLDTIMLLSQTPPYNLSLPFHFFLSPIWPWASNLSFLKVQKIVPSYQLNQLQIQEDKKKWTWRKQNKKKKKKAKHATPSSQCLSLRKISIEITGGHINKNSVLTSHLWLFFALQQIRIFLCTKPCLQPQQQHDQKEVDVNCLNLPF